MRRPVRQHAVLLLPLVLCAGSCPRVECMRHHFPRRSAARAPAIHAKEVGSNNAAFGNLRPVAAQAYSWSVSRLSARQENVRDAYSWSVESVVNASAVVGRAVGGLRVSQFPALLPGWLTSRVRRRKLGDDVEGEMEEQEGETSAAVIDVPDDTDDSGALAQPKRYIETFVGAGNKLYAIALLVVFALEMVGPVAAALCVRAALLQRAASPIAVLRMLAPLEGEPVLAALRRGVATLWLVGEATFYIACLCVAQWQNVRRGAIGPPPFSRTGSVEWRREIWRRILADTSQSPRDFVESWMYKEADLARDSPPQMLLAWARRRCRRGGGANRRRRRRRRRARRPAARASSRLVSHTRRSRAGISSTGCAARSLRGRAARSSAPMRPKSSHGTSMSSRRRSRRRRRARIRREAGAWSRPRSTRPSTTVRASPVG